MAKELCQIYPAMCKRLVDKEWARVRRANCGISAEMKQCGSSSSIVAATVWGCLLFSSIPSLHAFSSSAMPSRSRCHRFVKVENCSCLHPVKPRFRTGNTFRWSSEKDDPKGEKEIDEDTGDDDKNENTSLFSRFTSPILDDPGLPLADTLVTQIVGPSLQIFWLGLAHAPTPTWLKPVYDTALWQARGSLVAPTLIHGAGLACCWIAGALAAQSYRQDAIDPTIQGYWTIVWRLTQAGAFAVGLLILATQVDLFFEFGRNVQPGESPETDLRLLTAIVELLNDVVFEAVSIGALRFYLAFQTARRGQS